MCLICGLKGLCPCPKCLISKDSLSDLSLKADLHTPEHAVAILNQVGKLQNKTECENILKKVGFSLKLF